MLAGGGSGCRAVGRCSVGVTGRPGVQADGGHRVGVVKAGLGGLQVDAFLDQGGGGAGPVRMGSLSSICHQNGFTCSQTVTYDTLRTIWRVLRDPPFTCTYAIRERSRTDTRWEGVRRLRPPELTASGCL